MIREQIIWQPNETKNVYFLHVLERNNVRKSRVCGSLQSLLIVGLIYDHIVSFIDYTFFMKSVQWFLYTQAKLSS